MVTATSKQAYANNPGLITQRERVGEYLLQRTLDGRMSSDSDVANALGIPAGTVSARRNELFESRLVAFGMEWIPAMMVDKLDRATRQTVATWCMVIFHGDDVLTAKRRTIEFISQLKRKQNEIPDLL